MRLFRKIRSLAAIAFFAFGFFASAGPAGEEAFTLENGLTVILSEIPGSGAVSGYMAFRVGSGDEADESEFGMAHLLEHLLFRNVSRTGEGLVSNLVQDNGGYVNAFTSKEMTAYTLSLPKEAGLVLPSLLVDLVVNAQFAPDQLAEEQEIVVEEINGNDDDPDHQFYQANEAAYYGQDHPYGRPIAGTPATVRSQTGDSVRTFHSRFYRPDNAVMVLAGEFDPEAMKLAAADAAAGWSRPDSPLPVRSVPPAPERAAPVAAVRVDERAVLAKAVINFPAYSKQDDDHLAAALLASLLSGGAASRLDEKVWRDLKLVNGITAYTAAGSEDGRLGIMLVTEPGKLEAAVAAVFEVLAGLFPALPDAAELARAGTLLKMRQYSSQDDSRGVAMALIQAALIEGDWRNRRTFSARTDALGVEETMAVARSILSQNPVVTVMLPEGDDASASAMARNIEAAVRRIDMPAGTGRSHAAPEFVELEPVHGVRLAAMRDPNRSLVSVVAMARGGLLAETPDNNGIGRLMAAAWTKATENLPSRDLARETERLGAEITASSNSATASLSGEFLLDNWRESLALFAEVLARPAFHPDDVEEARRDLLARLAQRGNDLNGRVTQLANETQYAGHPFSLELDGREEAVAALTPEELAAWRRKIMADGETVITIAGNIDPDEARAILAAGLGGWGEGGKKSVVPIPPAPAAPDKPITVTREIDRTQTHLILAFPAPDLYSPDREAMKVLETSLNGLGGTLMVELREKGKLAYATYAAYRAAVGVGGIQFYISSDSSKTEAALAGMKTVIGGLIADGLTEEEVDAAKRLAVGQFRIFSQTLEQKTLQAALNMVNGMEIDYQERRLERIRAVTAEDVRRVIGKYISLDHAVVAVLGK